MKGIMVNIILGALLVLIVVVIASIFLSSGTKTEKSRFQVASIESIPGNYWVELAEKKIFFGHQSVGENLVEGMIDVMAEHPEIRLNFVEKTDLSSVEGPAFFHGKVGRNTRPDTKVESFRGIMTSEGGADVDIAFLKFCYVDMRRGSDPQVIFNDYQLAFADLKERYPETSFVHVTVPVESAPMGVKGVLKERLKTVLRRPGVLEDNSVRERYNEMLRTSYAGKEPIFDIARYESISPEGHMSYRTSTLGKVYLMDARYTDDGGHLNKLGRRIVAEQLLMKLAEVANDKGLVAVPSSK